MHTNLRYIDSIPPNSKVIPLDASSLKMAYCQQAYVYSIVEGLKEKATGEALVFGTAIHKFAEAMIRNPNDLAGGLDIARKHWATFSRDMKMLIAVCGAMPASLPSPASWINDDGTTTRGIEFYFSVPWLAFEANDETFAIVLMGTIDLLSFDGGILQVIDWKTSSKWKQEDIFAQYENDTQITFYLWVLWKFGHHFLPLEMANAARAGKITARVCAIQKKEVSPRWIMAPPQSIWESKALRFEENLRLHIHTDIIPAWESPENPAQNGWVSGRCGQCRYNKLCHEYDDGMRAAIREAMYVKRVYTPAEHGKK